MSEPSDFDWTEMKCILPVLRRNWDDETDPPSTFIEPCGSPLHLTRITGSSLLVGGECEGGSYWQVECDGHHVLFMPDDEGNDFEMPFDFADFQRAYGYIAEVVGRDRA